MIDKNFQRALAVLQLACAGELAVEYICRPGVDPSIPPFDAAGPLFPKWRIGKRFTLVAFNDCGCFDYFVSVCDGDTVIWSDDDTDLLNYLTADERRELGRLLRAEESMGAGSGPAPLRLWGLDSSTYSPNALDLIAEWRDGTYEPPGGCKLDHDDTTTCQHCTHSLIKEVEGLFLDSF